MIKASSKFRLVFNAVIVLALVLAAMCLYVTPAGAVPIDLWLPVDSGTEQHLYDVDMIDANTGWAVGSQFTVLKTIDGGATWTPQELDVDEEYAALYDVEFINANEGWIAGFGGTILHTTDGGTSWEEQDGPDAGWWRMQFIDSEHGWLSGLFGDFAYTTDGGATWTAGDTFDRVMFFMQFFDENNGFAAGKDGLFANTTDGGQTWNVRAGGTLKDLAAVDYFTDGRACTVGEDGTILTYSNVTGAVGWIDRTTTVNADLNSVYALDDDNGWVAGDNGVILFSINGGIRWNEQVSGTTADLNDIYFYDADTGWAVGNSGTILTTADGGTNWTSQKNGAINWTTENLTSVAFADADKGWAVGENGTILATTNGGSGWTAQTSTVTENLTSVTFVDDSAGWAMGESGTVLYTSNGGTSWASQTSGTSSALLSGDAIKATSTVWASGAGGTILKTTDGATWNTQTSSVTKELRGIAALNANNAVAVGADGIIIKTENGGTDWTIYGSPVSEHWVFSGFFLDASTGWVTGSDGLVLKTDDGGYSWSDISIPQAVAEGERLYDAHFLDEDRGWVTGKNGHIYKTVDGGVTWTLDFDGEIFGVTDRTYRIQFIDEHNAIGVGRYGVILKYGTVDVAQPDVEFNASRVAASTGRKITFNDESTGEAYYSPFSYEWDLGDSTITDEEKPVHGYTSSGKYSISLTVTNIAGEDEMTKAGYIYIAPKGKQGVATGIGLRITSINGNFNLRFREQSLVKRVGILITRIDDAGDVPTPPQGYVTTRSVYDIDIVDEDGDVVTTLTQAAEIVVEYTSGDVAAAGGDAGNLKLAYYDDTGSEWIVVDDAIVDKTARTISTDTTRLGIWAVMVEANSSGTSNSGGGCGAGAAAASTLQIASGFGLIGMLGVFGFVLTGKNHKSKKDKAQ